MMYPDGCESIIPKQTVEEAGGSIMKKQGYKFGVAWIALNDNAGENLSAEELSGTISVLLLADLFGKDPEKVAKDVIAYRLKTVP